MGKRSCNEYIIIRDDRKSWWFTYRKNSIFYKTRNKDGHWTKEVELLGNVLAGFSMDMDASGNLNLICLNKAGELLYLVYNGTHWYNKMLSVFSLERCSLEHLTVLCRDKYVNVFFILRQRKNPSFYSIRHNFWNGSKWKGFKVTRATGDGDTAPFYAGYDQKGIVHLVYEVSGLGGRQLYYCKFRTDYSLWGNPEKIAAPGGNSFYHYALTDKKDTLHLLWTEQGNGGIQIKYMQRARITQPINLWKSSFLISDKKADNGQPILYIIGNTQWVVWVHRGTLLGSFSYDEGENWTSPVTMDVPLECKLKMYNVALNSEEYPKISANLVYGYERDGDIRLPLIDDILADKITKDADCNMDLDMDKGRIKEYAVEAREYIGKLVEEVSRAEDRKKEVKGMMLKQANEMSRVYNDLEGFKKEVYQLGKRLEQAKSENFEIMSSINSWQDKFKKHQKTLEAISDKHKELSEVSKTLSERNFLRKILDYFK